MAARSTSGAKTTAAKAPAKTAASTKAPTAKAVTPRKAAQSPRQVAAPAQTAPPAPGPAAGANAETKPPVAPVVTRSMTNFERAAKDAPTEQAKAYWNAKVAEQASVTITRLPDAGSEPQENASAE